MRTNMLPYTSRDLIFFSFFASTHRFRYWKYIERGGGAKLGELNKNLSAWAHLYGEANFPNGMESYPRFESLAVVFCDHNSCNPLHTRLLGFCIFNILPWFFFRFFLCFVFFLSWERAQANNLWLASCLRFHYYLLRYPRVPRYLTDEAVCRLPDETRSLGIRTCVKLVEKFSLIRSLGQVSEARYPKSRCYVHTVDASSGARTKANSRSW